VKNGVGRLLFRLLAGVLALTVLCGLAGAQNSCPTFQWSCSNCLYDPCGGADIRDYEILFRRAHCTGDCDADCGDQGQCETTEVTVEGSCNGYYKVIYDSFCCEYCAY